MELVREASFDIIDGQLIITVELKEVGEMITQYEKDIMSGEIILYSLIEDVVITYAGENISPITYIISESKLIMKMKVDNLKTVVKAFKHNILKDLINKRIYRDRD